MPAKTRPGSRECPYRPPKTGCPIRKQAEQVQSLGEDLARAMRKLRRSMQACARCALHDECSLPGQFNLAIHTAIAEITLEWDL